MLHVDLKNEDCLEAMVNLDDNCIDAIVTDPPYGLSFMGKKWDYDVPSVEVWKECLRVLKPGGHMLVACGTRTQHRMAVNIEDAGFEIRDVITWLYGSGFPKSLDVSKAIDKAAGAEREVVGPKVRCDGKEAGLIKPMNNGAFADNHETIGKVVMETAPSTDLAKQWSGWGTALKPACEFWTLARKPLEGTVANNVQKHGVGGLNIDGCRVGTETIKTCAKKQMYGTGPSNNGKDYIIDNRDIPDSFHQGRFPANLILDEEAGALLDEQSGVSKSQVRKISDFEDTSIKNKVYGKGYIRQEGGQNDSGGASRFFYCAKASKSERNVGCEGLEPVVAGVGDERPSGQSMQRLDGRDERKMQNHHPTVKPIKLMRYLCRLITPPKGIVLDPFMGSGTTGIAAKLEGFRFKGVEREKEYFDIAERRIAANE